MFYLFGGKVLRFSDLERAIPAILSGLIALTPGPISGR
jgi:hypothetical protein